MKAVVHANDAPHQLEHAMIMLGGLTRHGIEARLGDYDTPEPCDFAVCWGARQERLFAAGRPLLIMERGHVGDRVAYTSVGWGGLGRRGRYPKAPDGGARWRARFGQLMQPWRYEPGYALVIGQVPGDAALRGLDVEAWARDTLARLDALGWDAGYRPHPLVTPSRTTLADQLAGSGLCVTYNSTAGVEAVLAGVPTVTLDEGAMAWPVTSHALAHQRWPDREAWAHDLAWTQWTREEIARGDAWAALGPIMEAA